MATTENKKKNAPQSDEAATEEKETNSGDGVQTTGDHHGSSEPVR